MGYSAGNLSVELFGIDTNAVASIDNTAKALKRLSGALRGIEKLQSLWTSEKLQYIFEGIAKATNSINATNIERLASATKSLTSLSKIGKLQDIDYGKIGQGFSNLTTAITPFIDKIKTAEASLVALYGTLSKAGAKGMRNALNNPQNPKSLSSPFLFFSKITTTYFIARRLGRIVANIAQSGADYTETLNLWETAMSDNLDLANKFVDKMNEAYGISEKTLMNAQATFKNMLGSLGQISESTAYALSEGITQMAIDYASLYNVTFEKAFEKFQAALAGQVRPIRSVSGYDITENTLFELYKQLGGTKSVRNLSRTEKQLLSILAIFNQMTASGAVGDLDKTMESYANQSRIMAEAWKEFVSYVGILLTHFVKASGLVTYISATLMYITDYLKDVANNLGAIQSFGGDVFGDTTDSIYGTIDAIDELNGKLLDFDKFRALNESEDSGVGLDEKLLEAFKRYETILANATNSARELANSWKDSPFSNAIVTIFHLIESVIKKISPILEEAFTIIGDIIEQALPVVSTIVEEISDALVPLLKMFKLSLDTSSRGGANILRIFNILANILSILEPIFDIIYSISWLISSVANILLWVVQAILMPFVGILEVILKVIETIVEVIHSLFTWDWGSLGNKLSKLWTNWELKGYIEGFSTSPIPQYADGGLPDKGTMFIAGEAGAEMVYNTPSGQSGVVNVQQIKQAMLGALIEYGQSQGGNQPIEVYLDGELVYRNTTAHAKKRGQVWGTV